MITTTPTTDPVSTNVTHLDKLPVEESTQAMLDVRHVCALVGLSVTTVMRWSDKGDFPKPIKYGKAKTSPIRWKRKDVIRWLSEKESNRQANRKSQ